MYHRSKMLSYLITNLPCNFVGVTLYKYNIPICNNSSLTKVGTTLYRLTPVTRLINNNNTDGLLTLLRSSLSTNTFIGSVISLCPYNILYAVISDSMSTYEISNYTKNILDFASHPYIYTILYTLYPYADDATKPRITDYLGCDVHNIDKKSSLIEQLNTIPIEHKLPWFEESVSAETKDITILFDEHRFSYELAVIVLDTLIEHTYDNKALKNIRSGLDNRDVLSLWGDADDIYSVQICVDAIDRGVIDIEDMRNISDNVSQVLYEEIRESKHQTLPSGGLHKLTALLIGFDSFHLHTYEEELVSGFMPDNCKFCASIKYD